MRIKPGNLAKYPVRARKVWQGIALTVLWLACVGILRANPQGMTVVKGTASATASGSQLNITASQNAFLNWQSFNIAPGEATIFHQPSAASIVWNKINDRNPSQIWGHLSANGIVVLMNQSGFFFGPGSVINAAGFVATTATTLPEFGTCGGWQFNGPPPLASIVNYGEINVQSGGSAFLIAEKIENHGIMMAPDGTLGLYAGKQLLMSERPDGRGLSVSVRLPQGSVDNQGKLVADAGSILLQARNVNQDGILQANSVRERNGVIQLLASESVALGANSLIEARGDDAAASSGGRITIKSEGAFSDASGSRLSVVGGFLGGDGGQVELSAPFMPAILSTIDGHAGAGSSGGSLLIDPQDINIGASGSGAASSATVPPTTGTLNLNVNSAFIGLANITLQASRNININSGITWDLATSTGDSAASGHLLSLQAGNDITFKQNASIVSDAAWSVSLFAGKDFSTPNGAKTGIGRIVFSDGSSLQAHDGTISLRAGKDVSLSNAQLLAGVGATPAVGGQLSIQAGTDITLQNNSSIVAGLLWSASLSAAGSILFEDTGSLATRDGAINLRAGKDVTVTSGFVHTVDGGKINVTAVSGSVDSGSNPNGLQFRASADVSHSDTYLQVARDDKGNIILGGISTAAGGDVNITAGQNIISYRPDGTYGDAGSGAFGAGLGNVSLSAGGDVVGHYVVRNGVGKISAGHNAGGEPDATSPLAGLPIALSLVAGGWEVQAGQNISLQEVRNPNGIFNSQNLLGSGNVASKHFFDYAPDAYVKLTAGNSVQLLGNGPRIPQEFDTPIPAIYAPSLEINAGAGGVSIANDVILFPSAVGQLTITTTGSLLGKKGGQLASLIMSDSAATRYTSIADFAAADHASRLWHVNDTQPVSLDIGGDISNMLLVSPKHAVLTIGGNMVESRFDVQNLHSSDVTSVTVGGDIVNRNQYNSVGLGSAPDLSIFDHIDPLNPKLGELSSLGGRFSYDPSTKMLTFKGPMTSDDYDALLNLKVESLDALGKPILGADGTPMLQTVHLLDKTTADSLFALAKDAPENYGTGCTIEGPGALNIAARTLDFGSTLGLQSVGPANNHALASLGHSGADINLSLSGNPNKQFALNMFASAIASLAGGAIVVDAKGAVNVGSSIFTGDQIARGIFTVAKSDVTVLADANINVNGSRIAAYDGGNVTVLSREGSVDAGHGGQGAVEVEKVVVDQHGNVLTYTPTIPGSGILATTFPHSLDPSFPDSKNEVGNIHVETPQGNIIASAGGIVQVALNHVNSKTASVTLIAGSKDAAGNVLYAGSIDASGSGVIGGNVNLEATAGIKGLIVAQQNINIAAGQNVNVTAIGSGNVSVSAGGTVSGTIVGVGGVSASGSSIDASLLSQNTVSANNANVGSSQVFAQANAAGATSQSTAGTDQEMKKAATSVTQQDQDDKKKPGAGNGPVLARRVGRVTVILPKS